MMLRNTKEEEEDNFVSILPNWLKIEDGVLKAVPEKAEVGTIDIVVNAITDTQHIAGKYRVINR